MTLVAEILAIGDELVHGALLDTNSKWLAGELEAIGALVQRFTVVSDDPVEGRKAIAESCARADVVVATGGLGPTLDDRTRDVVAEVLGGPLWFHEESWAQVQQVFHSRGRPVRSHLNPKRCHTVKATQRLCSPMGCSPSLKYPTAGRLLQINSPWRRLSS